MSLRVVVLGGYGNFGRRICEALARDTDMELRVAGRDLAQAASLAQRLGGRCEGLALDLAAPDLAARLRGCGAQLVIHAAGPFQGQDYAVARACLEAGCHYIDLADGRDYVCGIGALHAQAQAAGLLLASGASSAPALAAAVVDHYCPQFAQLESIRHAITAGARPPGVAAMRAVLSYAGKPFRRWQDGAWQRVYGWLGLHSRQLPQPLGRRWLANCDVPDLELFPQRYADLREVSFHAGVGYLASMLVTWLLSWLVRLRLLPGLAPFARPLHALAMWMAPWGTRDSGMWVELCGRGHDGLPLRREWVLLAGSDHGPQVPCMPAIALARKLASGGVRERGALPCMGLLELGEILGAVPGLDLRTQER